MPAFNFKARFAADVEWEIKHQTIRAKRKNRPRVGQQAICFTGMRTKQCRHLGTWTITAVHDVRIMSEGLLVNGGALIVSELDALAERDGFENYDQMSAWFEENHGLPFHGDLIIWKTEEGAA